MKSRISVYEGFPWPLSTNKEFSFIQKITNHLAFFSPSCFDTHTQAVSAVAAEDGVRFMQEMMELSSQQQKEQLPPRAIQIVSHPFYGRVVLTAGPAQFGTDLSKSSTGVSIQKKKKMLIHSLFLK